MKAFFLALALWLAGLVGTAVATLESILPPAATSTPSAQTASSTQKTAALPQASSRAVSQPAPLATTTAGIAVQAGKTEASSQEPAPPYTADFAVALERAIHKKINEQRAQNHLDPLLYDNSLVGIAREHSLDMAKNNYFAHEDAKGCDVACRLDQLRYNWLWAGENIFLFKSSYRYSVEEASSIIVEGWMGSEGHRANILDWHFQNEGMGVVILGNAIYATEDFSNPK